MIFNKLVAALSAVTMLGSLAVAVPASAAVPETVTIANQVKSSAAGSSTISGTDVGYTNADNAIWYLGTYDLSEIESITAYAALCPGTKNNTYVEPILKIAYCSVAGDVDAAYINNNSNTIRAANNLLYQFEGVTTEETTAVSTFDKFDTVTLANTKSVTGEVKLFLYATASNRRAYVQYVTINKSAYPAGSVAAYVSGGTTKYATELTSTLIKDEVDADSTITILDDIQLNERLTVEKNLTIAGDGTKTITGKSGTIAILAKANLTIDGVNVTANGNNALQVEGTNTLTVKNCTVTGKVRHGSGNNSVITLDNVTVDGVVETRRGADAATTENSYCTVNLTNGSKANEVIYYSEPDSGNKRDAVTVDTTSSATLTDKYVPATPNTVSYAFHSTIEQLKAKDDVTVTVSADGYDTSDPVSIKEKIAALPDGDGALLLGIVLTVPDGVNNVKVVVE